LASASEGPLVTPAIASLTAAAAPVAVPQTKTTEPAAVPPVPSQTNAEAQAAPVLTPVPTPSPAPSARAPVAVDDASREERVKMTRLRQTIARRLKDAQNTAAMLTTFNEVDMKPV